MSVPDDPYWSVDGRRLLAACVAAPDDDLPRLVYADWLEENGDPDRAAFIRYQIELAAEQPDFVFDMSMSSRTYTESGDARVREMYEALSAHLIARLLRYSERSFCTKTVYRRGFIVTNTDTVAGLLQDFPAVRPREPFAQLVPVDKSPVLSLGSYPGDSGWVWSEGGFLGTGWYLQHELPDPVYVRLAGGVEQREQGQNRQRGRRFRTYGSREAALVDLQLAVTAAVDTLAEVRRQPPVPVVTNLGANPWA